MTRRNDRPVHEVGAAFLFLGPAIAASIALLGFWLMEGLVDQDFRDIFANSDKLTTDASSKQLLAWILGLMVSGIIGGTIFLTVLLVLLWMIGIVLLLILRELSEINERRR